MNRERSTNSNRRRVMANGAAVALFMAICGIVAIAVTHRHAVLKSSSSAIESPTATAAVASPFMRGTIPKIHGGNQLQQQRRRRQQSSSLPASIEAPPTTFEEAAGISGHSKCSGMNRKQCTRDPACGLSSVTKECVCKSNGGEGSGIGEESDPCAQKSKFLCKQDRACKYKRKEGYCYSKLTKLDPKKNDDPQDGGTVGGDSRQDATDECLEGQCHSPEGFCKYLALCVVNPCATVRCEAGTVCQANYCGGCHATCGDPPPPPLLQEKYWPLPSSSEEGLHECVKSSEYPKSYSNVQIPYPLLFDTYDQCCADYPCVAGDGGAIEPTKPTLPRPDPVPRLDSSDPAKCAIGSAATLDLQTACITDDEFCQLHTGGCNTKPAVHFGICAAKPVACTMIYAPVCGCDTITYGNSCSAQSAGVSVLRMGECKNPVEPGEATTTDSTKPVLATLPASHTDPILLGTVPNLPSPTERMGQDPIFRMFQGPCTTVGDCEGDLVCHAASRKCICDTETNEGCNPGQICGVPPGVHCPPQGCLPTCTCDFTSDAIDGSNGCPMGEVCRSPCAIADAGPMCFKSNEKRDCDHWGSDYVCRDTNGDGVIDRKDGASGCVEKKRMKPLLLSPEVTGSTSVLSSATPQNVKRHRQHHHQ